MCQNSKIAIGAESLHPTVVFTVCRYHCVEGGILVGADTLYCDGHQWSDTPPRCVSKYLHTSYVLYNNNKLNFSFAEMSESKFEVI